MHNFVFLGFVHLDAFYEQFLLTENCIGNIKSPDYDVSLWSQAGFKYLYSSGCLLYLDISRLQESFTKEPRFLVLCQPLQCSESRSVKLILRKLSRDWWKRFADVSWYLRTSSKFHSWLHSLQTVHRWLWAKVICNFLSSSFTLDQASWQFCYLTLLSQFREIKNTNFHHDFCIREISQGEKPKKKLLRREADQYFAGVWQ